MLIAQSFDVTTVISTVGFPIVMCLILFNYITKFTATIQELTDKFTKALNDNTLILQKLCDSIDSEVNADGE